MLSVEFLYKEQVAQNVYSFWFKPSTPIRFVAGQFIELYLPHVEADNRGQKRWFTISSSPEDKHISITTKVIKDCSTFKKTLARLEPGAKLKMASPMGDFVLPKDANLPLLFVAGGIGCTPFHSIIKHLNGTGQTRDIRMIYATNSLEELVFKDTFKSLTRFDIVPTNPPDGWDKKSGHLEAQTILKASQNPDRHIYISGPEPMVEKLFKDLKSLGVNEKKIHGDYFPGYQPI